MQELLVSKTFQDKYDDYYGDEISEWRELGAMAKLKNIVTVCQDYAHAKVIEIGCGDGVILKKMAEIGFGEKLYGLEISSSALKVLQRQKIASLEESQLFNGYDIPYNDQEFDLAILSHVIEHVEYPRKLLKEAARVSKYLFIEVPLENTWRLPKDFIPDEMGHINFYSEKTIRRLVQSCDLKVLNQIVTNRSQITYEYQSGKKGTLKYLIKEVALQTMPAIAKQMFTYHSSLLCHKVPPNSQIGAHK